MVWAHINKISNIGFSVEDKGLKAMDNIDNNTKLSVELVEDNGGHKGTKKE